MMKPYLHISKLILGLAVILTAGVSCIKETSLTEVKVGREIAFNVSYPSVPGLTKGIVTGSTMEDNVEGMRPLYVTSYLHAQSGEDGCYFLAEKFENDGVAWSHDPAILWPIEGTLDFLAYSAASPFEDEDLTWPSGNTAQRLRIRVGNDRTQDDILFGSSWSDTQDGSAVGLSMKHCQAWLNVNVKLSEWTSITDIVLDKVVLEDAYLTGIINIENNFGSPTYEWDFRQSESRDRVMDDIDLVYGSTLTVEGLTVSMLVPEQPMKKIKIYCTVGGEERVFEKELPHANWVAGEKYEYDFVANLDNSVEPVYSFGGLLISSGEVYYNGTEYVIDDDWKHTESNDITGRTAGSYYHSFEQMCYPFMGHGLDDHDGRLRNLLDPFDGWRIPSKSEWEIIFTDDSSIRPGSTVNGSDNIHYAGVRLLDTDHVGCDTIYGFIIFPDDIIITGKELDFMDVNYNGDDTIYTDITEDELNVYLASGCVFLPASCYGEYGYFLASTTVSPVECDFLYFDEGSLYTDLGWLFIEDEVSVRLVKDVVSRPVLQSFGGLNIASAPLYYDGTNFIIKDNDWNHDSYNSVQGKNEGSYYFNYLELGSYFDSDGESFSISSGIIDNAHTISYGGYDDWRLPTSKELLSIASEHSTRIGSVINGNHYCQFAFTTVTGVVHAGYTNPCGLLIAPDFRTLTGKKNLKWNDDSFPTDNVLTIAELQDYLDDGCEFLPASGYPSSNGGVIGSYISTDYESDTYECVSRLYFTNAPYADIPSLSQRMSVRLVRNADEP